MSEREFLKEKDLLLNSIEKNTAKHWENYYSNVPIKCIFEDLVIDINEIKRLTEENQELKQKYLNAVADYETTMFEKEQLNSLVNSCQEEIRRLNKQLKERPKEYVFIGNAQNKTRDFINQITKDNKEYKNQQKEFIEYMNKTIEELECDDVDDEEMKAYLIQRIDTFKEILSKYKEIIGSDINVGSIGDKDEIK